MRKESMMKNKLKNRMIKILTAFLAIAVVAGFTPQMGGSAYASGDDSSPAITLGTGVLKQNVNTVDAQVLDFGSYSWYTIAYDGKDGNGALTYLDSTGTTKDLYPEGTVTLLSKSDTGYGVFDYDSEFFGTYAGGSNIYATSKLKEKVDGESGIVNNFSAGEQGAIQDRTLTGGGVVYSETGYDENLICGEPVEHALLWPLSVAEANMVALRNVFFYSWWLRSPGLNAGNAALVQGSGDNSKVDRIGDQVSNVFPDYRFAFFLDKNAVLFTSAAAGGKNTGDEGAGALLLQTDRYNSGNEWKVTVKDSLHSGFNVDNNGAKYDAKTGVATIPYSGARSGNNEFISAIITDKPAGDDTAKIKYYGRLAKSAGETGAVTINTAGKLGDGDFLYVFNEQCNNEATSDLPAQTDYASELKEVNLNKEPVPLAPAKMISGVPLATMTASGKTAMNIAWQKTEGVDGYDIFFAKCDGKGKTTAKNVKTIKGNSTFTWTASGLKAGVSYKAYVRAYVMKNGQKQYVKSSPLMHAYAKGYTKRYTNAKSVKVNKKKVSVKAGKSFKLKVKVRKLRKGKKLMQKKHELTIRYLSTDTKIATVSKKGKIKGVKAGTCYVYAYAHNGVFKKITVKVK